MKIAVRAAGAAVVSTAVCWAATAALGAGTLGAVGAWLSSPWIIAASTVLVAVAGVLLGSRARESRRRRAASASGYGPAADPEPGASPVLEQPAPDQVQPGG